MGTEGLSAIQSTGEQLRESVDTSRHSAKETTPGTIFRDDSIMGGDKQMHSFGRLRTNSLLGIFLSGGRTDKMMTFESAKMYLQIWRCQVLESAASSFLSRADVSQLGLVTQDNVRSSYKGEGKCTEPGLGVPWPDSCYGSCHFVMPASSKNSSQPAKLYFKPLRSCSSKAIQSARTCTASRARTSVALSLDMDCSCNPITHHSCYQFPGLELITEAPCVSW